MAIPFRSLRFPKGGGTQTWGIILERSYPRTLRHRIQSDPHDRNNQCTLCEANKVIGFEGIAAGKNLELAPTATATRTDQRNAFPTGPLEHGKVSADFGADLRGSLGRAPVQGARRGHRRGAIRPGEQGHLVFVTGTGRQRDLLRHLGRLAPLSGHPDGRVPGPLPVRRVERERRQVDRLDRGISVGANVPGWHPRRDDDRDADDVHRRVDSLLALDR